MERYLIKCAGGGVWWLVLVFKRNETITARIE